ncbi:MAG: hypothetical protein ACRC10_02130 [Thermoguttaceae bacterium]
MTNIIRRVYIDTSVVGGTFDKEFARQTEPFWRAVNDEEVMVVVSDLMKNELEGAPKHIRDFLDALPESQIEYITTTKASDQLAMQYIAENVVGRSSLDDCKHIALATLAGVDVLVSWNFKHIVNVNRIRRYNSVNMKLGYRQIDIRTPYEVINDET